MVRAPSLFLHRVLNGARLYSDVKSVDPEKLVLLGTGWGGYSLLKGLQRNNKYHVSVVSERNHFLFTPLLASTTVGTLEFRSIVEPVRSGFAFRNPSDMHCATATDIDPDRKVVRCRSMLHTSTTYELPYDKLVIAVGCLPNTFGTPGVREHAYFLKEVSDARKIRNHILKNFELASEAAVSEEKKDQLLHVVIVGGGPTGVEFAAEVYDFLETDVKKMFPNLRDHVKVSLIEPQTVLSAMDERLRQFTEQKLASRTNVEHIRSVVTSVRQDEVKLANGAILKCGLVVWSTGVGPRPLLQTLQFPKTPQGRVIVDEFLRVKGFDDIYAVGDCAADETHPLPPMAQVADRQGKYLAKALSEKSDSPATPFRFRSMGTMAYVGDFKSVADFSELSKHGRLSGFSAWLMWRGAYMTRLGNWKLRMQVPIDWFKTFFFGRDTSRFED